MALILCRHNVLIDDNFTAKVADFGFVTPLPQNVGSTAVVTAAGALLVLEDTLHQSMQMEKEEPKVMSIATEL